ncbi:MAG: class I SAM-dependent methyltransferase [Actinomycetia bacterium]|nr:class I SAM-dependent methyltransferase [Actinomycetes bacterium]MCP4088085.1 class I SAM-dependent methyltransferase [Actinomycetes bacterium]
MVRMRSELGGLLRRLARRSPDTSQYQDPSYFGAGRNPLDRMGLSGYERYDRATSNADVAAYLVWRWFNPARTLDAGCALGFVVEALQELEVDAEGIELSRWAVDNSADGARDHVRQGSLTDRLPWGDDSFDVVTSLEVLEHLEPDDVPAAIAELARVSRGWVVCTIPSFGVNDSGPDGWYQVKARDDLVAHYESLGPDFTGPLPRDHIYPDVDGEPIEGHLTMASYPWWTARFADAGLERMGGLERLVHRDLYRFGFTKYWNLYVLRADPSAPVPKGPLINESAAAERERTWGLDQRGPAPDDAALLEGRGILG